VNSQNQNTAAHSASLNNEWKWAAVCHFLRYRNAATTGYFKMRVTEVSSHTGSLGRLHRGPNPDFCVTKRGSTSFRSGRFDGTSTTGGTRDDPRLAHSWAECFL